MPKIRIVLANGSLAGYPQAGGLWSLFLQYLFGLRDLGHDVFWLELFRSTRDPPRDHRLIGTFLRRFRRYGFGDRCALLLYGTDLAELTLERAEAYGATVARIREIARSADLTWNFACAVRQPLLSLFRRPVLIDGDPGHLQVSALTWDMGIPGHQAFLTAGTKLHDPDCGVPTLGLEWQPFVQFVYLPLWPVAPDPGPRAPFSSITEWTWEQLALDGHLLSVSKRDAYLRHLVLAQRTGRPFTLAVNFHPSDATGDRERLEAHGWTVVHPHRIARSPSAYRRFIRQSRAEILCPKPIHRALRTGWFSERSAAYLASGRPVLTEDTGFGDALPTGDGLLTFRTLDEAVAGVEDIDSRYAHHSRAARELAVAHLDSRKCLESMLTASL